MPNGYIVVSLSADGRASAIRDGALVSGDELATIQQIASAVTYESLDEALINRYPSLDIVVCKEGDVRSIHPSLSFPVEADA